MYICRFRTGLLGAELRSRSPIGIRQSRSSSFLRCRARHRLGVALLETMEATTPRRTRSARLTLPLTHIRTRNIASP